MANQNPYSPPTSPEPSKVRGPLSKLKPLVLALITLQVILMALYSPAVLNLARQGGISTLTLMGSFLAMAFLAVAGVLLFARRRLAIHYSASAGALSIVALLGWQPILIFSCLVISLLAVGASIAVAKEAGQA